MKKKQKNYWVKIAKIYTFKIGYKFNKYSTKTCVVKVPADMRMKSSMDVC